MDLFDIKSEEWQLTAVNNNFGYLEYKAKLFLEIGAIKYAEDDALRFPNSSWSQRDLEITQNGCRQILEGRGVLISEPICDVEIRGFNLLFKLFHYKSVSRKTKHRAEWNGNKGIIDSITFAHLVDGNQITYHHFISTK